MVVTNKLTTPFSVISSILTLAQALPFIMLLKYIENNRSFSRHRTPLEGTRNLDGRFVITDVGALRIVFIFFISSTVHELEIGDLLMDENEDLKC